MEDVWRSVEEPALLLVVQIAGVSAGIQYQEPEEQQRDVSRESQFCDRAKLL
jgi:hypothetical protein